MLNPASSLSALLDAPIRDGALHWIGLRPGRRDAVLAKERAELEVGRGITGDRYNKLGGSRQVTLITAESLSAIAAHLGVPDLDPALLRRNLVVSGINLFALKGRRFTVGNAVLEASGECHPCSRMEETLGPGGYNAVRGLGGMTARVVGAGVITLGDRVTRLDR